MHNLLRAQNIFEFLSLLHLSNCWEKEEIIKKLQRKSFVKNIENIYRYSYTSTLHALWICPLESKYLHLRAAGERRTKLIRLVGITFFLS